jgi:hypothetical protein
MTAIIVVAHSDAIVVSLAKFYLFQFRLTIPVILNKNKK